MKRRGIRFESRLMAEFKDYFSTRSAHYAAYRPVYPLALVDFLAGLAPGRALALDCGCGSGQLSTRLAERFDHVVAIDASAQQIANAVPHSAVEYRVAPAGESGLLAASADLITAAQAAHWFDLDSFYAEARRVGRPRAILALVAYGDPYMDDEACERLMRRFYNEDVGRYWPPERRLVLNGYRELPFPFAEIEAPPFAIEVAWDLGALIGYAETWSATKAAAKALGREPTEAWRTELAEVWGAPDQKKKMWWPLFMRIGRV